MVKYFLINILGDIIDEVQYPSFLNEIYRIASNPTEIENNIKK